MCEVKSQLQHLFYFYFHLTCAHPPRPARGTHGCYLRSCAPTCLSVLLTGDGMRRDRCQSAGPGDNGVTQPALAGNLSSRLYRCQTFELSGSLGITMLVWDLKCVSLHYVWLIYGSVDNLFNAWMDVFVFMWHLPLLSHDLCMKPLTPLDTAASQYSLFWTVQVMVWYILLL